MSKKSPQNLSVESKKIWNKICQEYTGLDTYFFTVLKVCLESYDRLQQARIIIDGEGAMVKTPTGFLRENPMLKVEKDARSGFLQSARMLNLNLEPPGDVGRPPGT